MAPLVALAASSPAIRGPQLLEVTAGRPRPLAMTIGSGVGPTAQVGHIVSRDLKAWRGTVTPRTVRIQTILVASLMDIQGLSRLLQPWNVRYGAWALFRLLAYTTSQAAAVYHHMP